MASFPRPISHTPYGHMVQNHGLPTAANGPPEGNWEAIPQPLGTIGLDRPQDPHFVDVTYNDVVDRHPLPLRVPPGPNVFPNERIAQDIPAPGRPNPAESHECDIFPYDPQHAPPVPAFPDPIANWIPRGQPAAENLRRLAIRYLQHPDSQVDLVSMEPGAAGLCKVVIVLELADVL